MPADQSDVHDPAESEAKVLAFPAQPRTDHEVQEAPLKEVVGAVLRAERQRQGRTLIDVADAAAVAVSYLSELERGQKDVSSEVLGAIVGALDLHLADVLERSANRLRLGAGRTDGRPMMLAA